MNNDKDKIKRDLKLRIYRWILRLVKTIDQLPRDNTSQIIANQIVRSGTSIGANYIEGQCASSKKDFINFLHHSLKSANESKFWLALLRDTNKLDRIVAKELLSELEELCNILGASLLTAKGKR